ncbi:MAG TPA: xanthine dehydrogenase family protein subunit M [Dehalococcoidia bacterium]|nr:xanthine dehydrogenase family protein subunit M [Dehalococcoidia bacterium]
MRELDYLAPATVAEAVAVLRQHDGQARCLAGGTDLIAQLKERRRQASVVVDIKRIPDLQVLSYDPANGLRIGAAVTCTAVARQPEVQANYPALAYACGLVGSRQIQNRATVGGNVCNAAPSGDTLGPLLCYGARARIAGPGGQREIPLQEIWAGPGQTTLAPGELLTEVILPPPADRSAVHYLRFIPREEMDIAVAGVGSWVRLAPGPRRECVEARIALCAVGPTMLRAPAAEAALVGRQLPDEDAFAEAGRLAAEAARPISDVRGSADYRRELVNVLTIRTLRAATAAVG